MQNINNDIAIVIVTYNRKNDLVNLIHQIAEQDMMPGKVIVINNGELYSLDKLFSDIPFELVEIRNEKNSLTVGRNKGLSETNAELIFMLDDDIQINPTYISTLANFMYTNPKIMGCSAAIEFGHRNKLVDRYNRFFKLFYVGDNAGVVFESIQGNFPNICEEEFSRSQWLSGTNQCYRNVVFDTLWWDENLQLYCEGEDIDFSFRASRKFGDLAIINSERIVHNVSETSRLPASKLVLMQEIYGIYLLEKLFGISLKNLSIYYWSRFGRFLHLLIQMCKTRKLGYLKVCIYTVYAICVSVRCFREITNGELSRINEEYFL